MPLNSWKEYVNRHSWVLSNSLHRRREATPSSRLEPQPSEDEMDHPHTEGESPPIVNTKALINSITGVFREAPEPPPPESPPIVDKTALMNSITRVFRMKNPTSRTKGREDADDDSTVGYTNEHEDDDGNEEEGYFVPSSSDEKSGLLLHDELNAKVRLLQRQVVENSVELQQFKKSVTTSRGNRKKQLVKLENKIDEVEEDPILPQDTYSFFAITRFKVRSERSGSRRCPEIPFGLAHFVFLLQVVTLTFLAVDVVDMDNEHNPLGIPPGVDWTVQVCQLIALFITVITQDEVRLSLNVFFDGYVEAEAAFKAIDCNKISKVKWLVSAILRLCAGVFSLALTFMLIISSNEVRDLLLNFTAVEFISNVDDTIFLLSKWGYFGPRACKEANTIANAKPVKNTESFLQDLEAQEHAETGTNVKQDRAHGPGGSASTIDISAVSIRKDRSNRSSDGAHNNRCRCSRRALILMAIWFIMFIAWIILSVCQGRGLFLPKTITVQFGDERMAALGTFSGLYKMDKRGRLIFGNRKKYIAAHGYGKFEYCNGEKIWTFSFGEQPGAVVEDPCGAGKRFVRAQSAESDVFDLTRKPLDTWYHRSASNVTQLVPLEQFSIDKRNEDCGTFGTKSVEGGCICKNGWFGDNCLLGSCQAMQIKEGFFNDTIQWSERYRILKNNDTTGSPVQVYGRPVFVGKTRQGDTDVMFFTGRRWVLTHTGRFTMATNGPTDIASFFGDSFHAHWTKYTVSFISEAVDDPVIFDSNNKAAIPTGLVWFQSSKNNIDTLSPNMNMRSDALLACTCAVNAALEDGFQCENNGSCLEDGTCSCDRGFSGERCEISSEGNGLCNRYFNTQEGGFDGGDCCNSTCSGGDYLCGLNERGDYIGFPNCNDTSQRGNGLCDLALNTAENGWDGGDCCNTTCTIGSHPSNCGNISESVLGGLDVGYPFCRDPGVIGSESCVSWTNLTIVLELGSHYEDAGFLFNCDDRLIANSSAGEFKDQQRRTGTIVVRDGAFCNLVAKGNRTEGRFKAYYGQATTTEDMLIEDVILPIGKNISFTASPPSLVDITVWARRDNSTHPVQLGLMCSSLLQSHNESFYRELDFDDSWNASETASVRNASWCQFDERGKEEYEIFFEGDASDSIFHGQHRDGERTTVFFQAVEPVDMVQVVAVVKHGTDSSQTEISLRRRRDGGVDEIYYSAESPHLESVSLRHVYVVPKQTQCLFTVADSGGIVADSRYGSYQLFYSYAEEGVEDILLFKSDISYGRESVYFDTSTPEGVVTTTVLYEGHNMPGSSFAFDLQCNSSFPQDKVSEETRSVILLPKGTNCSFMMASTAQDVSNPPCSRGQGFFRVYDGIDTSTDKLLARGSQIQGEPVSFVTGSLQPLLPFVASVQFNRTSGLNGTYEDTQFNVTTGSPPPLLSLQLNRTFGVNDTFGVTQLNVECDNALEVDKVFNESSEKSFQVREGASCELTFVDLNNTGHFQVHYALGNGTRGHEIVEGGGSDGGDRFLFMASSRQMELVPVTVVIDWKTRARKTIDDFALRMTCGSVFSVYYADRDHALDLMTFETLLVPKGIECEMMIVNIGNEECCNDDKVNFEVKAGNETIKAGNKTIAGEFGCRASSSFTANASEPEEEISGLRALLRQLISG